MLLGFRITGKNVLLSFKHSSIDKQAYANIFYEELTILLVSFYLCLFKFS